MRNCEGCDDRDRQIAELKTRIAELERFQRESLYLRDATKADQDLRLLTGESPAMKDVRKAISRLLKPTARSLFSGKRVPARNWSPAPSTRSAHAVAIYLLQSIAQL